MFELIQALSVAGNDVNEDVYWLGKTDLVFLDGASSLGSSSHDAVEFVNAFIESYKRIAIQNAPLYDSVNLALDAIKDWFAKENYDANISPSASAIIARSSVHGVDLVLVGDCTAIVYESNGLARRLYCSEVERFDNRALILAQNISQQDGVPMAEAVHSARVRECLVSNRKMMNAKDGYRILASNMKPLRKSDIIHYERGEVNRILFHSDGFDAVKDDFMHPPFDIPELFEKLRTLQEADDDLESMPRFRIHDDTSALYVRVV